MINLITKIYLTVLSIIFIASSLTLTLLNGVAVNGVHPSTITLTLQESIVYDVARQCLVITVILGFIYMIFSAIDDE